MPLDPTSGTNPEPANQPHWTDLFELAVLAVKYAKPDEALQWAERAVKTARDVLPRLDLRWGPLKGVYAHALAENHKYALAAETIREVLALQAEMGRKENEGTVSEHMLVADWELRAQNYAAGLEALDKAAAVLQKVSRPDPLLTLACCTQTAFALTALGRDREAGEKIGAALYAAANAAPELLSKVSGLFVHLAESYQEIGKLPEAEYLFLEVWRQVTRAGLLPEPEALPMARMVLRSLASCQSQQQKYGEAFDTAQRLYNLDQENPRPRLRAAQMMARICELKGDPDQGEDAIRVEVERRQGELTSRADASFVPWILAVGEACLGSLKATEALDYCRKARGLQEAAGDTDSTADILRMEGMSAAICGDIEKAEASFREQLAWLEKTPGVALKQIGRAALNLVQILVHREEKLEEAEELIERVTNIFYPTDRMSHTFAYVTCLFVKAQAEAQQGNLASAVELLEQARDEYLVASCGRDLVQLADILGELGGVYAAFGRLDEAEEALEKSLAILKQWHHEHGATYMKCVRMLSDVAAQRGDEERARELGEEAKAIIEDMNRRNDGVILADLDGPDL